MSKKVMKKYIIINNIHLIQMYIYDIYTFVLNVYFYIIICLTNNDIDDEI